MEPNKRIESVFSSVDLQQYRYHLPAERIARYPLAERDQSKLLVCRDSDITHKRFYELPDELPANSLLVFNNTKVIPARLHFQKASGAQIELFLLQPEAPSREITQAMQAGSGVRWQCMIGNLKRWKNEQPLLREIPFRDSTLKIEARLIEREQRLVEFHWSPASLPFAELVQALGEVPLPPYLNRKAEPEDAPRYQTVYSREAGAVAAPTAGLHFTQAVLDQLKSKGHRQTELTLHVSAGTFQPIKSERLQEHPMHREQVVLSRDNLQALLQAEGPVIAVGTTSMRSLESLYWFGVSLIKNMDARFFISKSYAYEFEETELPARDQALQAVLRYMDSQQIDRLYGETEIFIFPGYKFRVCDGLLTNFHQPESTLILLVAAFLGSDWKRVYAEALSNDYRFLSYGDSSLLLPPKP